MNKASYLYRFFVIGAILFLAGCSWKPTEIIKKKKAVFIFSDVTSSLIKLENEQVGDLTADVLDRLPLGSVYKVIPIHMKTETAEEIAEKKDPIEFSGEVPNDIKEGRRKNIKDKIKYWYDIVNSEEKKTERTCIIKGLEQARQFFITYPDNEFEYELILISDMIEHCQTIPSAKGEIVSLKDQPPDKAFELIKNTSFPDFSKARITIIFPGKNERVDYNEPKPAIETLNAFWSRVFKECNNDMVTKDRWFTATIPNDIFAPQDK